MVPRSRYIQRRLRPALAAGLVLAFLACASAGAAAHHPSRPDLRVSKLAGPPATLAPGGTFAQGYAVKDAGGAKAKASTIRFYASRGKKHAAGDELLGSGK